MNKRYTLILSVITAIIIVTVLALPTMSSAQEDPEKVVIKVMIRDNELSEDEITFFEESNPDIDIVRVDDTSESLRNFELALASDDAPDVMRITGGFIDGLYNRGLLLDITDYIATSDVIDVDDLAPVSAFYVFDDRYYGMPKDWSVSMLFINTLMFEEAGLPLPSTEVPLTYAELAELAEQLTIVENGEIVQMGLGGLNITHFVTNPLLQIGKSDVLFDEDFDTVNLTGDPAIVEVMRYYYDMSLDGTTYSVVNPSPSWLAFTDGQVAMEFTGYWFQATVNEDKPTFGHVLALPLPVWSHDLPRISPTGGPTGLAIFSGTEHPDEAFRFLEYYTALEPAVGRAQSGWGMPILRSLEDQLPVGTEFQQQVLELAQTEIEYIVPIPVIPYTTFSPTLSESWDRNVERAAAGEITFDELLVNVEQEVNLALLDEALSAN